MLADMRQLKPVLAIAAVAATLAAPPAAAQPLHAAYVMRWVGIEIGRIEAELRHGDGDYHLAYRSWTTGPLRWIADIRSEGWATGRIGADGRPVALHFRGRSAWEEGLSFWELSFGPDGRVTRLVLDEETRDDREPVPEPLRMAPDPMTLMLQAMGEVAAGRQIEASSFDGRRAMRYAMRCAEDTATIEPVALGGEPRHALFCQADGELVGGRSKRWGAQVDEETQDREPTRIWFVPELGSMPHWPVRVEAMSRYGRITVELDRLIEPALAASE